MFSFIRFQMDRFKEKRTKRRYLTNKKTNLWRGQEIQLRPVDKATVMSSKSKSYRYLVLVKFVLFNIDYTYCDENHMVEEMCISHQ